MLTAFAITKTHGILITLFTKNQMADLTGYDMSRSWFNWSFENPEIINPAHSAIFFFAIEHCNRLGWKAKFGFPTQMVMDAVGIKKHSTYIKYFNDLCEWGFFELVQKSTNQYSANIISLQCAKPKNGKALDKAFITHAAKQTEKHGQSTGKSKRSIDKPLTINQEPDNQEPQTSELTVWPSFDDFWNLYDKKQDRPKCEKKWKKITQGAREKIIEHLRHYVQSTPDKQYRKNPITYLNNESWNNEITIPHGTNGFTAKQQADRSLIDGFAKRVIERNKVG